MDRRSRKTLEDIRDAAEFVLDVTSGKSLEDYSGDRLLRNAVERNLEVIGEAVRRLADHDPATARGISQHRRIVDFRNVLIHGYDLVDHELVWSVIRERLPELLAEIHRLISSDLDSRS